MPDIEERQPERLQDLDSAGIVGTDQVERPASMHRRLRRGRSQRVVRGAHERIDERIANRVEVLGAGPER